MQDSISTNNLYYDNRLIDTSDKCVKKCNKQGKNVIFSPKCGI